MRPLKSVVAIGLLLILLSTPVLQAGVTKDDVIVSVIDTTEEIPTNNTDSNVANSLSTSLDKEAKDLYESMRLRRYGLTQNAFVFAWKGYKKLLEKGSIYKKGVLSIADFSQSSRRKRLYVLDVETKKVLVNTYVAHGRNSGGEYAKSFSNKPESHKSSLGFYVTRKTYWGDHGLALNIDGVERGINDLANDRNIVVHGSEYVGADFLRWNRFNGRSYGCPAVPAKDTKKVINSIKDGSCFFIYHPSKNYLQKSKILNG